ncbi:MAG: hypothetical protein VZR09_05965, partial [Candidatus Gastranaerophilaceae bacterium]|nr:hypothetical protein [Candidatus Gastranaerophilaceae bacterium]
TDWGHTYYDRWTDTTTGKSIAVSENKLVYNVINHQSQEKSSLGDTLKLVNNDTTNSTKDFTAQTDGMTYTVSDNLGATNGTLNVNGKAGGNAETIDLKDFTGFEVGAGATALNFNNVTVGSSTATNPTLITVSNGSATIGLSNAILNGAITGTVNYDMTTNGNTTVVGAITNANIENSGILTAGAVTGNITNDGTSVTTGGLVTGDVTNNTGTYTNNGGISGNVENSGIFESNALISGGTITNNTGASLTSNASNLGSAVTNNGDLYLTGTGTNGNAITGSGTTYISAGADVTNNSTIAQAVINNATLTNTSTISGNVTNNSSIDNTSGVISGNVVNASGAGITSSADNITGTITNNGSLTLTGGTTQNTISGNGTTDITGDLTVNKALQQSVLKLSGGKTSLTSPSTVAVTTLDASGGALNLQNNNIGAINLTNLKLNSDMNLSIDADLNTKTEDTISATSVDANGHKVIIDSIKVLADPADAVPVDVVVADSNLKEHVRLTTSTMNVDGATPGISYLVTYTASGGTLNFGYSNLVSAVQSTADSKNYTMAGDENITATIGTLNGDELTVNGQGNTINSSSTANDGISVGDNKTLNINNATISNFGTALENSSAGEINLTNVVFSGNNTDVDNDGTLNLNNVQVTGGISGTGTTNIAAGTSSIFDADVTQTAVAVGSGASLDNNAAITADVINSGNLDNSDGSISGNVTNNSVLNNAGGIINGVVTNNVNGTVDNTSGSIVGNVINNSTGLIDNTSGSITGNVLNANSGTITNAGGTISGNVDNTASGNINNSGTITGNVNNTGSGILDNTGGTIGGNVVNNGSLISSADDIAGTISNNGTFTMNGGAVQNGITGTGATNITAGTSSSFDADVTQSTVSVGSGASLDNNATITAAVTNNGNLDNSGGSINGNVVNNGNLSSVADDIAGTIANNGTFTMNGGTVQNDITGTGTTNITADLNNPQTIGQDTITVNSGVTVTNSGTINAATALTLNGDLNNSVGSSLTAGTLNNNGTLQNLGSVTVGGGVNSGNIKGIGSLTNTGSFTNNSSIVQNTVANSGNLVNNGTIVAASVTNSAGSTITSDTQNLISSSPIANNGTLNLTGGTTYSDILGAATGKVNINSDSSSFILNNKIQGNELTFNGDVLKFGTNGNLANVSQFNFNANAVDLVNNNISNTNFGNLNLLSDMNLSLDGNFAQQTLDTISVTGFNSNGNFINISDINILEPTTAQTFSISPIGEDVSGSVRSALASAIRYTGGDLVYSPIFKYSAAYDPASGMINFTNLNGGNNFNPAVLVAPVVAQSAGQVIMWQNFNTAFEHADTFMPYPKALRTAQQNANMYAISTDYNDNIDVISEMGYEHTNLAGWVKPYTSFESLRLTNGPKLDMISYGSIIGGDSDFRKLKNGWSNVGTVYIGYNGSQIDYDDVDVTTNGGTLGITESFYKNNFFTAITAAVGAGVAQAHTMYGKEDLTTIMAGIGSKSGYNFEFLDGRFIIQPTLQLNYSMVKTFDYTNAAGVRVNSDPAHTLQINPNIRFIGNFKGGWQPYASVGMIWNVMNISHNIANGAELPRMYTKPYVEYGVGLQKQIGEKFSGYGQVMVRNGGRTGVALTAGFRWYIGRKKDDNKTLEKNVGNKTVVKKSKTTSKKKSSKKPAGASSVKNEYNLDLIQLNSAKSQVKTEPEKKKPANNAVNSSNADKTKNVIKSAKSASAKKVNNSRARYEKYFEN